MTHRITSQIYLPPAANFINTRRPPFTQQPCPRPWSKAVSLPIRPHPQRPHARSQRPSRICQPSFATASTNLQVSSLARRESFEKSNADNSSLGCGRYYEQPVSSHYRHSVSGDYSIKDHRKVHGCKDGAACPMAPWNQYLDWAPAVILVNSAHDNSTRLLAYGGYPRVCTPETHRKALQCHEATTEQPDITRVSSAVREDTLSIFYGGHPFVFRFISSDGTDKHKILQYLDTIGPHNARRLEEVHIVYARKKQAKEIEKDVLREMKVRGVSTGGMANLGVVRLTRLGWPFSQTDSGVLDAVTRARGLNY